MITGLRIGNFKAFGQTQHVPIRPLTLIFGANSSGKSSLIHALLLAHHAIETGELDTHRTIIGGDSVDLGGFRQYVYRRNTSLHVEWVADFSTVNLTQKVKELLPGIKSVSVGLTIGPRSMLDLLYDLGLGDSTLLQIADQIATTLTEDDEETDSLDSLEKKMKLRSELVEKIRRRRPGRELMTLRELDIAEGNIHIETLWLEVNGARLLSMKYENGNYLKLQNLNTQHPVIAEIIATMFQRTVGSRKDEIQDIRDVEQIVQDLIPNILFELGNFLPNRLRDSKSRSELLKGSALINEENKREGFRKAITLFLPRVLEEMVATLSQVVEEKIKNLIYLGPLRSYPPRHIDFSQHHDASWKPGGSDAWDIVRRSPQVRSLVNEWLGDNEKLSTPYELKVKNLVALEEIEPRFNELIKRFFDDMASQWAEDNSKFATIPDFESKMYELPEHLSKWAHLLPVVQELALFDKRSGTLVSHRDVGIGISQVLPVLVNTFALSQSIIAMEQPEIHLHPALQAELGDVFIKSALGEQKNTFILETHSEHLLLRIMRRMRETANGTLPAGIPPVRPEDVAVLYVERDGQQSIVREMPLNEHGELVKAWPGGFFEEGLREVLPTYDR